MTGSSAVMSDALVLSVAFFCLLAAASAYRSRRTAGAAMILVLLAGIALAVAGQLTIQAYYWLWTRSLQPKDIVSMSLSGVEVADSEDKEALVEALRSCAWYFRTRRLDGVTSLVLRLQSGRQIRWRVGYDRGSRGAVVLFSDAGPGIHLGQVFAPELSRVASRVGIAPKEWPSGSY